MFKFRDKTCFSHLDFYEAASDNFFYKLQCDDPKQNPTL